MTNLKHVVIVKKILLIIKQPQRRCFSSKCFISLSLFGFCFFPTPICCVPFLLLFVFFWLSNEKYSETKTKTAFGIFPIKSTFWVSSLFLKKVSLVIQLLKRVLRQLFAWFKHVIAIEGSKDHYPTKLVPVRDTRSPLLEQMDFAII